MDTVYFFTNYIGEIDYSLIMDKKTTLTIAAVLAAAAVVIGTLASPAFADSSSTTTVQVNKQTITSSGFVNLNSQSAFNCIAILNTNPC
jgi:hypothetical protein